MRANPKPLDHVLPFSADRWCYLILFLALTLRTYHLAYPPWDYHNWRQTITLMVARNFARHNFHLLHPQVSWVGGDRPSDPSYFSAEFSIQSILAALLYKIFGESDTLARIIVIAFSLLGIYSLYDLLNRRAGPMAARLGAFIYALLPYHVFFARVFMPDIPALALALGGLNALDRWTEDRKRGTLVAAAALTALAILQKLALVFVALPALYLFWLAQGRDLLARREPYIFGMIAGIPTLAWYAHAVAMAHQSVFAIQRDLFAQHLELWFQLPFVGAVLRALSVEAFSPLGAGLAAIGLFCPARDQTAWIFRLWALGAALLLTLVPGVLPSNYYYLCLLLPAGAALAGLALARLARDRRAYPIVILILIAFTAGAIHSALPLYHPDRAPHDLGVLLNHLTNAGDLVVTETGGSPNVLYSADRRGWMLWREYNLARLEHLRQAGARYYADAFLADAKEQREFFGMLDSRFERLTTEDSPWPIYYLAGPPGPLRTLPDGEIQDRHRVNFGRQIELRGISVRKLLDWPASFEVIYYWYCLAQPAADLQIFVHITNSLGQTVYQQDHWPQGERLPTSRWKAGDVVRERYVVVLPGSLPGGKYQIWLGWFDPARGPRLRVLNPEASDQADRALVAEIKVRRQPKYGWFRPD